MSYKHLPATTRTRHPDHLLVLDAIDILGITAGFYGIFINMFGVRPGFDDGTGARMTTSISEGIGASPSTRPTTPEQRQQALWFSLFLIAVTAGLIPVADAKWLQISAFIPAYQTAVILAHSIAAYLIFSHFRGTRCVALLWLGCGCLYTAIILFAQFLSFPGMFAPYGLLPGGTQTTIWLWVLWHLGPAVGMLLYTVSEWYRPGRLVSDPVRAARRAIGYMLGLMVASLITVTIFSDYLPILDVNGDFNQITLSGVAPLIEIVTATGLTLLWWITGFRTALPLWIGVALVALLCDNAVTMAGGTRLSVGWYIGRFDALVSSCVLLFGYLREINRVYLRTVAHAQELAASNEVLGTQVVESRLQLDKARYDHLTRLPSRALFLDRAEALRARSALDGSSVAVLFIDLDGFKRVNDTLGHDRGDAVLVEAADALRSVVREKDIAGRMGGDEFAVFLVAPKSAIETLATSIAHRIVAAIGRIGDGIGCSIGVALCPAGCGDLTCALRQADEAMYSAKRAGKNRYAVYGPVDETIEP